jgi:hypothetical protein
MEQELKLHTFRLEKLFHVVNDTDLRRAFESAEVSGISRPFNKNQRLAFKGWAPSFVKRQVIDHLFVVHESPSRLRFRLFQTCSL